MERDKYVDDRIVRNVATYNWGEDIDEIKGKKSDMKDKGEQT